MPNLILNGYDNGFSWQITGLGNPFNTSYYISAGITIYRFTTEASSVSGTVDNVSATSNRTLYSTPERNVSYTSGTYTFYAWARAANGTYYPAGSSTVTVTVPASTRPTNWYWNSAISSGRTVNIGASEWNNFCSRINDFRVYKGLSEYSFTTARSGRTEISASICNEAWYAINGISGHGTMPSRAVSGGPMYASFFNNLQSALNSIS